MYFIFWKLTDTNIIKFQYFNRGCTSIIVYYTQATFVFYANNYNSLFVKIYTFLYTHFDYLSCVFFIKFSLLPYIQSFRNDDSFVNLFRLHVLSVYYDSTIFVKPSIIIFLVKTLLTNTKTT